MGRHGTSTLVLVCIATWALPAVAWEAPPPADTPRVVIAVAQADTARREFVAGKIIIGRQRIEQSGARTVEELLKREPAVSVSADGRIGLLNMPGYTQVLVDGRPPMGGKTADLDLVHVEKIEIIKSSVAEYGSFGIAGTINIISRKSARTTRTMVKVDARTGGRRGQGISFSHDQNTEGSPLRFSINVALDDAIKKSASHLRQTRTRAGIAEQEHYLANTNEQFRTRGTDLSANIAWQRAADETVTLTPSIWKMTFDSARAEARRWADGTAVNSNDNDHSTLDMLRLPLAWSFKPGKTSQVDISLRTVVTRAEKIATRIDAVSQGRTVRQLDERTEGTHHHADIGYKVKLPAGHNLKTGASVGRTGQDIAYAYRIDAQTDPALAALGSHRNAATREHRMHVQDEWQITESVGLNAGVAMADTAIAVTEGPACGQVRFRSWSPSLHLAKKIGEDDEHRFRFSLARSYTAPDANQYTLRPAIHPLAPCPANGICEANTIDTADSLGNLGLRPERALGLNLAYEYSIGENSELTLEAFTRRIDNKVGTSIGLESVSWSPAPRYVSRPVNLGDAWTSGIDLEMEVALRDLVKAAPKVMLRGNLGLARSHITSLPGPDSRLDQQTPWTGKLGVAYAVHGMPLKIDVNANWRPSVWARTSMAERVLLGGRAQFEGSAIWNVNKSRRAVINFRRQFPSTANKINEYTAQTEQLRLYTKERQYGELRVSFETTL